MLKNSEFTFYTFLLLHVSVWVLVPSLFHPNAPLDVIECATWGHMWQWGYDKHPPLASWLTEIFIIIFGHGKLWHIFLLSQICIAVGFVAVWRLARQFLSAERSLLAVLLLEGVYYYNYTSPEFNPNVLLLALWPLFILHFWYTLEKGRPWRWAMLGFIGGIAILAKYYSAFLLLTALLYLLVDKGRRRYFLTYSPYLALAALIATLSPHIVWMFDSGFSTISYGMQRTEVATDSSGHKILPHILHPLRFLWAQILSCMAAFILIITLKPRFSNIKTDKNSFFIATFTFGPLILTLISSFIFGFRLKSMWGTPLWPLLGIFLMLFVNSDIGQKHLSRFIKIWCFIFLLAPAIYITQHIVEPQILNKTTRANFPGRDIADFVSKKWQDKFGNELPVIGGSLWLAGNVSFYLAHRPLVYVDIEHKKSLWVDDDMLQEKGGIVVWDAGYFTTSPYSDSLSDFTNIEIQEPHDFSWIKAKNIPKFRLGWAIIPPGEPPRGKPRGITSGVARVQAALAPYLPYPAFLCNFE